MKERFSILLIEDNPGDVRLLQEMLKEAAGAVFDVEQAERLSAGLERLAEGNIDAVLLDLSLPDSHGLDTFIRLQAQAPHVPITVLTGLDDSTIALQAVRQGAQDYLVKGKIDSVLLTRTIQYAIERKQTEEALRESLQFNSGLLGNSPHPILVVNPDSSIRYANPALEKLTGFPATELHDQVPPYPWWPEEAVQLMSAQLQKAVRNGMERVENQFQKKNGEQFWVEITSAPITSNGELGYYLENWANITERKRAEEEIRRRAAHLGALNAVIAAATAATNLSDLLRLALEHTLKALNLTRGAIWRTGQYITQDLPESEGINAHEALATTLALFGTTAVEDWQQVTAGTSLARIAPTVAQFDIRASLTASLLVEERRIGGLAIVSSEPRSWPEDEIALVEAIGQQLGAAAERLRLFQIEQEQRELVEALQEAAAVVTGTLHQDEVLDRILEQVERVVPGNAFNIMLLMEDRKARIARRRGYNRSTTKEEAEQTFSPDEIPTLQKMMQTGETVIIPDTTVDRAWVTLEDREWLRSYVGAPIRIGGVTVGFLNVNGTHRGQFGIEDARRLQAFANHAAVAIQNARLYQELASYAEQLEERVTERTGQIQAHYAQLEAILNSSSDGIIVTDESGEIIQANPIAQTWLNQSLSPQDAALLRETVHNLVARAYTHPEEMLELTGLDLELSAAPISSPGQEGATAVVAVHDISHLKALDRMKSRFVSNVSHELRTPITTIKLYTALMQQAPQEKWQDYLEMLSQEADRQAKLVEDILQVSRIDAGRLEMKYKPTSLNHLAENTYANHRVLAENRGLDMQYRPTDPDPSVLVDPERTMQVLSNLTTNAVLYTPQGGEIVIVTDQVKTGDRSWATVTISDTGIGIPEHEIPHVFDRFFRGEQPRLMQVSGTGLGLAIVKEIVELQGGQVTVESKVNEGTTFTIWLPLAGQT